MLKTYFCSNYVTLDLLCSAFASLPVTSATKIEQIQIKVGHQYSRCHPHLSAGHDICVRPVNVLLRGLCGLFY